MTPKNDYPKDATVALQQKAGGDWNLDIGPDQIFIQNEVMHTVSGDTPYSWFVTEQAPVLSGTLTGTVYLGNVPIHTFIEETEGVIRIYDLCDPSVRTTDVSIDYVTGELGLSWSEAPGPHHCVINYEYSTECQCHMPEDSGCSYPSDDIYSMNQGCGGEVLNIYYAPEFIENETTETEDGEEETQIYSPLEHAPIVAGTITGTVYRGDLAVQTFVISEAGNFAFTAIGTPEVLAIGGRVNLASGEIAIEWNEVPGPNHLVVSYEYDEVQPTQKKASRPDRATFQKPTFENFFSHEELEQIRQIAGTIITWDFCTALGHTIKERYEGLYCKVNELTNVLVAKGAAGYFWMVMSPEIASIFETAVAGFVPSCTCEEDSNTHPNLNGHSPLGLAAVDYVGLVNGKWRLYKDAEFEQGQILVGCNDALESSIHYGRLNIANFII